MGCARRAGGQRAKRGGGVLGSPTLPPLGAFITALLDGFGLNSSLALGATARRQTGAHQVMSVMGRAAALSPPEPPSGRPHAGGSLRRLSTPPLPHCCLPFAAPRVEVAFDRTIWGSACSTPCFRAPPSPSPLHAGMLGGDGRRAATGWRGATHFSIC